MHNAKKPIFDTCQNKFLNEILCQIQFQYYTKVNNRKLDDLWHQLRSKVDGQVRNRICVQALIQSNV